ncbi:hypothetical protein QBC36DRAFT_325288 [Triangularia setosa]|uniref:Uncharacterized protein n=1 Tax=Triangularia setosa TaxID=2587417 RepID=A0AAN7A8R2_9PEZI|nr:hypothetical protein QBC36DRAFT_325288 [Podospora setosa]
MPPYAIQSELGHHHHNQQFSPTTTVMNRYNATAVAASTTAIYGLAVAGCLYTSIRLVLDLINKHKTGGKTHRNDDVESDTPSHTKRSLTVVRVVTLAGVICALLGNILSITRFWYLSESYDEFMARHTAVYFFSTAETALVFITALLVTGKFTPSSPMSMIRVIQYIFIVFIGLFALILFIMGCVQNYAPMSYDSLQGVYQNFSHAHLALLGVATFAISASLIKRIIHVRRVRVSTAERCALYAFTSATLPVLAGQVILSIVFRTTNVARIPFMQIENPNGYFAYYYISLIFYVLGDVLIFEFARKAAKKLSTC